ncbi:hypothetical protein BCR44DRAFT_32829 [Catenaria anguillulae PL171]|uniref:Secreted protein n=1 Tax=Catenaria anguillulae PL171 TaxID=765915 RepID=A0A1Y2H8U7_9FUNG|nr:hypothetical protein BCR44DRAFT_32829 [Catenaria anguillulae PL171]
MVCCTFLASLSSMLPASAATARPPTNVESQPSINGSRIWPRHLESVFGPPPPAARSSVLAEPTTVQANPTHRLPATARYPLPTAHLPYRIQLANVHVTPLPHLAHPLHLTSGWASHSRAIYKA